MPTSNFMFTWNRSCKSNQIISDTRLHALLFLHAHREAPALIREILEESDQFRFLRAPCMTNLKGSVGLILLKVSATRRVCNVCWFLYFRSNLALRTNICNKKSRGTWHLINISVWRSGTGLSCWWNTWLACWCNTSVSLTWVTTGLHVVHSSQYCLLWLTVVISAPRIHWLTRGTGNVFLFIINR